MISHRKLPTSNFSALLAEQQLSEVTPATADGNVIDVNNLAGSTIAQVKNTHTQALRIKSYIVSFNFSNFFPEGVWYFVKLHSLNFLWLRFPNYQASVGIIAKEIILLGPLPKMQNNGPEKL